MDPAESRRGHVSGDDLPGEPALHSSSTSMREGLLTYFKH